MRFLRDDSGAIAPLIAVALGGILAIGALAWDLSRGFALRSEIEAAVDAAALAGATQLDGTTGAVARATAAAQGALVQNAQRLAGVAEANVTVANADISFLQDLTTRTAYTADSDANFIQINLAPRSLGLTFGAFARVTSLSVRAHAVAGYGAAICKVPPLAVCNPLEASEPNFDADNHVGQSLVLTVPAGNQNPAPGFYGFLTVNGSSSGNLIKEAMGRNPPLAECYGKNVEARFGNVTSADAYFNTRFDIFGQGGTNGLTGDPAYAPSQNTIVGIKANANTCGPNNVPEPTNQCPPAGNATSPMGLPVDNGQSASAGGIGSGVWCASAYFARNHSSIANPSTYTPQVPSGATGSGWAAYGPSGGAGATSPTRFQVYNWELAQLNNQITRTFSASQADTTGNDKDFATAQCNKTTPPAGPDRRTISAVVINCVANPPRPNTTVPVISYIDLFLIAPAANQAIYGEIIGATTDTSAVGKETKLYSVRLYE
ncbi:MAG: pilus assembly protein TadG-related protein [Phenylobacterium sp.]|uniref:pilus assembly protein TadG-related protein n=1 Tax=Phenylobacterium sp. TaxID=1871053 RepID=UPI0027365432|nr:pilus assembly protein TadG-related protein [Phenylobacterium sp.]MDP3173180.1 pilus assembly protein TadG-related protein [Phenylobacterium sp.]